LIPWISNDIRHNLMGILNSMDEASHTRTTTCKVITLTLLRGLLELHHFRNPVDDCVDGIVSGLRDGFVKVYRLIILNFEAKE
jgi:hypothetical protein